ncbi:MAG: PKD domain-containing protein [Thermoplasmata archaeon]|nr:MAG: PKD domain-containing protein [Thermoplasmata archaeon]
MKKISKNLVLAVLICAVMLTPASNIFAKTASIHDHSKGTLDGGGGCNGGHLLNATVLPWEANYTPLGPALGWSPPEADFGSMYEGKTFRWSYAIWYSTYSDDETIVPYHLKIKYQSGDEEHPWVSLFPTDGVLCPENGYSMIGDICVDTTGLSPGYHLATVIIDSPAKSTGEMLYNTPKQMLIKVHVYRFYGGGPTLRYWPPAPTLIFDRSNSADGQTKTFQIWNSGKGTLTYSFFTYPPCPWVSITPASGTSTGEKDTITVTVNPSQITCGSGTLAYIYIVSNGGWRGDGRNIDYSSGAGNAVGYIRVWRTNMKNSYDSHDLKYDVKTGKIELPEINRTRTYNPKYDSNENTVDTGSNIPHSTYHIITPGNDVRPVGGKKTTKPDFNGIMPTIKHDTIDNDTDITPPRGNHKPAVLDPHGPYVGDVGEPIKFHATFDRGSNPRYYYQYYTFGWYFGDGFNEENGESHIIERTTHGNKITLINPPKRESVALNNQNPTHVYNKPGVYEVTVFYYYILDWKNIPLLSDLQWCLPDNPPGDTYIYHTATTTVYVGVDPPEDSGQSIDDMIKEKLRLREINITDEKPNGAGNTLPDLPNVDSNDGDEQVSEDGSGYQPDTVETGKPVENGTTAEINESNSAPGVPLDNNNGSNKVDNSGHENNDDKGFNMLHLLLERLFERFDDNGFLKTMLSKRFAR